MEKLIKEINKEFEEFHNKNNNGFEISDYGLDVENKWSGTIDFGSSNDNFDRFIEIKARLEDLNKYLAKKYNLKFTFFITNRESNGYEYDHKNELGKDLLVTIENELFEKVRIENCELSIFDREYDNWNGYRYTIESNTEELFKYKDTLKEINRELALKYKVLVKFDYWTHLSSNQIVERIEG